METMQAPNIEPGANGRLVYDKTRRMIVGTQTAPDKHPGGWPRIWPYDTLRRRVREAWWVLRGRWSLHQAWQRGYDQHAIDESLRRARGGR